MATFTKILSDTKTHAKVLLSFDNDSATTAAAVDASALSGHADGAKLHITHINHGIVGRVQLQFKGASADVEAIDMSGDVAEPLDGTLVGVFSFRTPKGEFPISSANSEPLLS